MIFGDPPVGCPGTGGHGVATLLNWLAVATAFVGAIGARLRTAFAAEVDLAARAARVVAESAGEAVARLSPATSDVHASTAMACRAQCNLGRARTRSRETNITEMHLGL